LYPVKVLGPGSRIGIWVSGCPQRCPGCINPELWAQSPEYEISIGRLCEVIDCIASEHSVDGFTISGGEPMAQAEELDALIQRLTAVNGDILVYSGYRIATLREWRSPHVDSILRSVAVLIDGPYVEEMNNNAILRGSENQNIMILNDRFKEKYETYFKTAHNQIQNFSTADGIVSVGIHSKDFRRKIASQINREGA
jgi:anaerobic ribonucleoside-triphosphate reductase activating protein